MSVWRSAAHGEGQRRAFPTAWSSRSSKLGGSWTAPSCREPVAPEGRETHGGRRERAGAPSHPPGGLFSASGPAARTGLVLCLPGSGGSQATGTATCAPRGNRAWMQHACGWAQGSARLAWLLLSIAGFRGGLIRYCFACVFAMFLFQRCAQDNPISLRDLAGLVLF